MLGSAPWRRAPLLLLRYPATLLAVAGASAVLSVVASGQSQYVSSSAGGALSGQLAQRCSYSEGAWVLGSERAAAAAAGETRILDHRAATDLSVAGAPSDALGPAVTTLAVNVPVAAATGTGRATATVTLYDRDGAVGHVHIDQRAASPTAAGGRGVWLTDSTASQLGVRAGDEVELGPVKEAVAGVYANLQDATRPLPQFWCSQETGLAGYIGPPDANFPPPPLALVGRQVFDDVAAFVSPGAVAYQWQRPVASRGLTLEQGRSTVSALSRLAAQMPSAGPFPRRGQLQMVPTDMAFVVDRSAAISQAVSHSVSPVTLSGVVVALLLMMSAASYWVDRRRREVALLRSRGVSPAMIAVKAVLETGPWALLGTAMGIGVARGVVLALGPSSAISPGSLGRGIEAASTALVIGLTTAGAVAARRAAGRGRRRAPSPTRLLRWVPVELVVLGVALLAWWLLSGTDSDVAPAGSTVASVGPLYLAFPVLFVAGAAALVVRLAVWALPAVRRGAARRGAGLFIGAARLAAEPLLGGSLLAASAMAVGMLVFAAALTATQAATVDSKAQTFVGANTAVYLNSPLALPAPLRSDSTVIERLSQAVVGGQSVDVIGVDPATFGRAAFWSTAYGAGSLGQAMALLARAPAPPGVIPAIVANGSVGGHPSLSVAVDSSGVPASRAVRVLEQVPGFTGANGENTLLITDAPLLSTLGAQSEVLSRASANTVVSALARSGATVNVIVSAGNVLDLSEFLSVSWSFAYLQALGILIGLIVVAGMLLYIETRQRTRVAAYVMARRMGLTPRSHLVAVAVELGASMVVGTAVGAGLGLAAAASVYGNLDPLPSLPPGPLMVWPGVVLISAGAATLMLWGSGTAWAQRGVDRASPAVVLRGEQ